MSTPPLYLLLCSGEHEKIQMAAMTASVAAVSERPVHVFVSMNAMYAFRKGISADERYHGGAFSRVIRKKKVPDAMMLFEQGRMPGDGWQKSATRWPEPSHTRVTGAWFAFSFMCAIGKEMI